MNVAFLCGCRLGHNVKCQETYSHASVHMDRFPVLPLVVASWLLTARLIPSPTLRWP